MNDYDDNDPYYDGPDEEFGPVEDIDIDEPSGSGGGEGGDVVQRMLLSYLSSNYEMWIRCAPVLDEKYFDGDYQTVVRSIKEFERKHNKLPSKSMIEADTGMRLEIPEDVDDVRVIQIVCDRVEEFCRHQAAVDFLINTADIINKDRSRGTLTSLVSEMSRIAGISVRQDLGYEVHEHVAQLLEMAEQSDALPTGFDFLDASLNGGVTQPSFNLVSAASGQGKSVYLQNQAINYARQGHNVVYISLELPEFMLMKRFAAMMTDTDINMIYANIDTVRMKLRNSSRREGRIQIKRMSMTNTTLADIRAYVNELVSATGLVWSHIMIDYMDLMRPMRPGIRPDNIHLKDQAVSEELYEWTHEPGSLKVVWSASQQVKGAKDEKDARQSGVAGGVGKVNTCDNLLILKRSLEDIQEQRTWCHVEKGRNGGQGMRIPFMWDGGTQRMSNPIEFEDLFIEANSPGGKEKEERKSKMSNDPLVRAKTEDNKRSGITKLDVAKKIKDAAKRGAKQ